MVSGGGGGVWGVEAGGGVGEVEGGGGVSGGGDGVGEVEAGGGVARGYVKYVAYVGRGRTVRLGLDTSAVWEDAGQD